MRVVLHLAALLGLTVALGCSSSARVTTEARSADPLIAGEQIIPTRYAGDRFYATPVLPRGDTAVIFLDTGGGTLVWEPYTAWLGLTIDTVLNARGAKVAVTAMPEFLPDRSLPPIVASPYAKELSLTGRSLTAAAGAQPLLTRKVVVRADTVFTTSAARRDCDWKAYDCPRSAALHLEFNGTHRGNGTPLQVRVIPVHRQPGTASLRQAIPSLSVSPPSSTIGAP